MSGHLTAFYEFGPFRLNVRERSLLREGEQVPLTPRTFETLLVLVRNRDRVVDKQELMDILWPDSEVEENNLSQSISAVRKALGERTGEQKYIKTITRRGYRFVATVREVRADSTSTAEGQGASPPGADAYQDTITGRDAERGLTQEGPQVEGHQSGERKRRLSKRVLTVVASLALFVVISIVVLRTGKNSEERAAPSAVGLVSAGPHGEKVEVDVWWPKDGVRVSGTHPFKAIVTNLPLSEYTMYWQVDGDRLNPLANNYEEYPHKEILVDLSGWRWRGDGPYKVNFVAKDALGKTIAEREVKIYVSP
jgi:DNA-binding winged helix-turn-helix (wHTH) protein